jgi:hypothetical protein
VKVSGHVVRTVGVAALRWVVFMAAVAGVVWFLWKVVAPLAAPGPFQW